MRSRWTPGPRDERELSETMSGSPEVNARTEIRDGMRITWHQPIERDAGVVLRADVSRPTEDGRYPAILSYGVYAKGLAYQHDYQCIEWAGTAPWSNGEVGMLGISYYASNQWRAAGMHPPHLAAIIPWEGQGWASSRRSSTTAPGARAA